jgi:hypothetical protein
MSEPVPGGDAVRRLRKALQPGISRAQPSHVKLTRIRAPAVDVPSLAAELCRWYATQGLQTSTATTPTGLTVQCRTTGALKPRLGLDVALAVVLRHEGADLLVEIEPPNWWGKSLSAWRQYRLEQQTIDFLRAVVPTHASGVSAAPPALAQPPNQPARPVDVATATMEQLSAIPGLDPASARLIVEGRTRGGGYRSLADVQRLLANQIQPHHFRRLAPALTLSQPAPSPDDRRGDARDIG